MPENAVPKIEGHAAFYAHLRNGQINDARVIGLENDRFVEKILFGRKYYEAPIITSRICGLCPTIHNVTSTRAIESACAITPSKQTVELRKLMLSGQTIQSHALHLHLLVLPDFVGASSSFELQQTHPDLFASAIKLKQFADLVIAKIGGRAVHPVSSVPGGFKGKPTIADLKEIKAKISEAKEIAKKTIALFNTFQYPKVERELIFMSLYEPEKYAYYQGELKTSDGHQFEAKNNKDFVHEELRSYTRAKFGTLRGKELMVGAMARVNINRRQLHQEVKDIILEHNIKKYFDNPFDNIIAQALEILQSVIEIEKITDYFIKEGIDRHDPVKLPNKFGLGSEACEAPRGTLFHQYELDENGYIIGCNIITPTVQNLPAMEFDMKKLNPVIADMKKPERDQLIEMLIRAYDPCITCATH